MKENEIKIKSIERVKSIENIIKKENKDEIKIPAEKMDSMMYFRISFKKNGNDYEVGFLSSQYPVIDKKSGICYFQKFLGDEYGAGASSAPFINNSQILVGDTNSYKICDDIRRTISEYLEEIYKEQKAWYIKYGGLDNNNENNQNYFSWKKSIISDGHCSK